MNIITKEMDLENMHSQKIGDIIRESMDPSNSFITAKSSFYYIDNSTE
jgi:hypothetical protein